MKCKTPGHTPGSLTMLIPVKEKGKPRLLAYFAGIRNHMLKPDAHATFEKAYERIAPILAAAKVDGFIASHPNYDDAVFKIEVMRSDPTLPDPFLVGTDRTVLYTKIVRECNLNNADLEKDPKFRWNREPGTRPAGVPLP
jgi:metallo-beta-lactamase class B